MIGVISRSPYFSNAISNSWFPPGWERVGKIAFVALSFVSALVFFSGNFRKKAEVVHPPKKIDPDPKVIPSLAAFSPVTPPSPTYLYDALRWSDADKWKIREIITITGQYSLGEMSFFQYIMNAPRFRRYEDDMDSTEVEGVSLHPFKFLETVFANPELKKYMKPIFEDFFLRSIFMIGVSKGMNRERVKENIEPHIDSFAQAVGISPDAIRPLIRDREWEKMVRCLIGEAGAPQLGKPLA